MGLGPSILLLCNWLPFPRNLLFTKFQSIITSNYPSFKWTVHPGNSKHKRLLLELAISYFVLLSQSLFVPCLFENVYWKGKCLVESVYRRGHSSLERRVMSYSFFIICLLTCKPGDITNSSIFAKVFMIGEPLLMPFYTSVISGTRQHIKKGWTVLYNVLQVLDVLRFINLMLINWFNQVD